MNNINRCPFCGTDMLAVKPYAGGFPWENGGAHQVVCDMCHHAGPAAGTPEQAVEWWHQGTGLLLDCEDAEEHGRQELWFLHQHRGPTPGDADSVERHWHRQGHQTMEVVS